MNSKKPIISAIPAILVMILIFCFSAQHAGTSNASSNYIVDELVKADLSIRRFLGLKEIAVNKEILAFAVRKLAHTLEYAVLGASIAFYIHQYDFKGWRRFFSILGTGFLYACTDELHQYFVPGRSCEFRDVLIDTNGVFIGILAVTAVAGIRNKLRIKNSSK